MQPFFPRWAIFRARILVSRVHAAAATASSRLLGRQLLPALQTPPADAGFPKLPELVLGLLVFFFLPLQEPGVFLQPALQWDFMWLQEFPSNTRDTFPQIIRTLIN